MPIIDRTIIDQLEKAPLFVKCGSTFEKDLPPYIIKQVLSKEEVKININLTNWENFEIEGLNILRSYLRNYPRNRKQEEESQKWNDIVIQYKEQLIDLEKIAQNFILISGLDITLVNSFKWIVLLMCMENHFKKINSKIPILFLHMLPLYEAGHTPCGWKGPIEKKNDGKSIDISRGLLLIY